MALRIISRNVADTATTLTASTTSGSLAASNMQTDLKGQPHRSTGSSVTYTLTWTNGENIGGIALPATNLSATATIRVRAYSDTDGSSQIFDSGTINACPSVANRPAGWTGAITANAFALGAVSKTAVWNTAQPLTRRIVIDLVDTSNAAGFIDCSRLVIGPYWEPSVQADYGVRAGPVDTTTRRRNYAGDPLTELGHVHDSMTLSLKLMPETDRASLAQIIRNVGVRGNVFLSLVPGNSLNASEQDHMIYGFRSNDPWTFDFFNGFGHTMTLEGW